MFWASAAIEVFQKFAAWRLLSVCVCIWSREVDRILFIKF